MLWADEAMKVIENIRDVGLKAITWTGAISFQV